MEVPRIFFMPTTAALPTARRPVSFSARRRKLLMFLRLPRNRLIDLYRDVSVNRVPFATQKAI